MNDLFIRIMQDIKYGHLAKFQYNSYYFYIFTTIERVRYTDTFYLWHYDEMNQGKYMNPIHNILTTKKYSDILRCFYGDLHDELFFNFLGDNRDHLTTRAFIMAEMGDWGWGI